MADPELVVDGSGNWSLAVPGALADGVYPVTATVTDAAGNVADDATADELVIDTAAPSAPTVSTQVTSDTTPTISGTAAVGVGERLSVTIDGDTYTTADPALSISGGGNWSLAVPGALAEGTYPVTATVTDAAGNATDDATTDELVIDATAPNLPTVRSQVTDDDTPTIAGTATLAGGESLSVRVNGRTYTTVDPELAVDGSGGWTLALTSALADGTYPVTATITDGAGNTSDDASTDELIVDTVAPGAPTVDALTSDSATPTITGTATPGVDETLTVSVDGTVYTAGAPGSGAPLIDEGDGTWTLTVPASDPLGEGTHDVVATVIDAAGNASADASADELVVDTTAPSVPTVVARSTNDTTPTITGTATLAAGETLSVTLAGTTYTAGAPSSGDPLIENGDGTWTLTVPASGSLVEGTYPVTATITDAAGNASDDATTDELEIDVTAPSAPTVDALASDSDTPTITGTAAPGAGETLTVTVGGVAYTAGAPGSGDPLIDDGDGTWTLTVPASTPLAEGIHEVVATVTDAAGNAAGDATTDELIVDTSPPLAPTVVAQVTTDTTPALSGTVQLGTGEIFAVTVDGTSYTLGDGHLVDNGDDTWTLEIPTTDALVDGVYPVIATVVDAVGRTASDTTTDELTVDTTAPRIPTVAAVVTNDASPTIAGTAAVAPGETLSVTLDGTTHVAGAPGSGAALIDHGDGTWTLVSPVALEEATYDVTATVVDAAGNSVTDATLGEVRVDLTAPDAPGVLSQTTSDTTPTIEGTAALGGEDVLTVTIDGTSYTTGPGRDGSLIDGGDGTWRLTVPASAALTDALYQVVAIVTDRAGNAATDPGTDELVVDTTAPATPGVTSLTTNSVTPVITGTASPQPGETLSVTVGGVTYIVGPAGDGSLIDRGDGTWTLRVPASNALPEGHHDVVATVTDDAGNTTDDPSSGELLIDTTPPVTPVADPLVTADPTPTLTGTAVTGAGETFTVTVDGVTYAPGDGSLVDSGDGRWSLTLPNELPVGRYPVTVEVIDAAGNRSVSDGGAELVITAATALVVDVDDRGVPGSATPTLGGATGAPDGSRIVVTDGNGDVVCTAPVVNGRWSCDVAAPLPEGERSLTVNVLDPDGNDTGVATPIAITVSTDTDGDGLPDALEGDGDFDGDGVPDARDLDADNDGIPDAAEGVRDSDGDGRPDYLDLDSDNDGIADIVEVFGEDVDHDFRVDGFVDRDGNGLSDDLQIAPFELVDTDGDLVPDFRDVDSDNDGITDLLESGGVDDDHDGRIDAFSDGDADGRADGADDARQRAAPAGRDSDGDGVPNRLDLDTDNDGLMDVVESGGLDERGDGIADAMHDVDGDGIPDTVDVDQTGGSDADADGIDDRFDASFVLEDDLDGDGIVDSADPDADGDGLADDPGNVLAIGAALPDTDGNDVADVLEPDGVLRTGLKGRGGCSVAGASSGDEDTLFALLLAGAAALCRRRRRRSFSARADRAARRAHAPIAAARAAARAAAVDRSSLAPLATRVTILAALALSSQAAADGPDPRPWVGVGLGLSHLDPEASEIPQTVTDRRGAAARVALGLDVSPRLAAELSFTDLGEAGLSGGNRVTYEQLTADLLVYAFADEARREHRLGLMPFGRIGLSSMSNRTELPYERENDLSLAFGGGVEYGLRNGLAARAEVISFDVDALFAGLTLVYRFRGHDHEGTAVGPASVAAPAESVASEPPIAAARPDELRLGPVLFDTDSAALDGAAERAIGRIVRELTDHPDHRVTLTGYADVRGTSSYNRALAQRRVDLVRAALVGRGVDVAGFASRAAGETDRFGSMATAEGRRQNRRVEVIATRD